MTRLSSSQEKLCIPSHQLPTSIYTRPMRLLCLAVRAPTKLEALLSRSGWATGCTWTVASPTCPSNCCQRPRVPCCRMTDQRDRVRASLDQPRASRRLRAFCLLHLLHLITSCTCQPRLCLPCHQSPYALIYDSPDFLRLFRHDIHVHLGDCLLLTPHC